jgi:glycosyltransferase involved in cell wall biosynthesis
MIRVAHVVSSLAIGGAERLVIDLACAQLAAGMMPAIVDLARDEGPLTADARARGVRVAEVGHSRSRVGRMTALARELVRHADAVHLHNPWALRAALPLLPAITGPVVYTRHGASPYARASWRAIHRLARPFIDHVTFVTAEARAAFEATHGAVTAHHLIPNGVAVPAESLVRARARQLRLGVVGRLVELKGQHVVIDALAGLPAGVRERVQLHLFGDGPERDRLRALAAARVPVAFHGFVTDREQIYAAIDVLVVASRTEGQSMAIVEAMARGLPVIATAVGDNPVLVRAGETGLLVAYGDARALGAAITRLLDSPDLVAAFGRAGRARAAAHHTIEAVVTKYRALYARA